MRMFLLQNTMSSFGDTWEPYEPEVPVKPNPEAAKVGLYQVDANVTEGTSATFELRRSGNVNTSVEALIDASSSGGDVDLVINPTYEYQWTRDDDPITGANAATYVLTAADAGAAIRCTVALRNTIGRTVATSNAKTVGAVTSPYPSRLRWASSAWVFQDIYATQNGNSNIFVDRLAAFGNWRKRTCDFAQTFCGEKMTWADISSSSNYVTKTNGQIHTMMKKGWRVDHAHPLLCPGSAAKFQDCFNGEFDDEHTASATTIGTWYATLPNPKPTFWLRLGWEASSDQYPSGFGNLASATEKTYYARAWKRIALIYKDKIPGVVMVWNLLSHRNYDYDLYYPGGDVVDIIGCDPYDNGYEGSHFGDDPVGTGKNTVAQFNKWAGSNNNGFWKGPRGCWQYAKSKGKQVSFDEWGPTNQIVADNKDHPELWREDGSNNVLYMQEMWKLFNEIANDTSQFAGGGLAYECEFNATPMHTVYPEQDYLDNSSAAYLTAYTP